MKERIEQLKSIITQRANYYSNIGFNNLANEFTNILNILNEIELMVEETEELSARVQAMDTITQNNSILAGAIAQSYAHENEERERRNDEV